MVDLSIIIVNWNTGDLLIQCLTSVFQKIQKLTIQIIVVDNGSQDGSGNEVKKAFPAVHLIEDEKNLGFAKAANQGLQKGSGRYILLLNPDTQVKSGAIDRLVSFMDAHSDVGVAGAQLLNADGTKQNSIANFPSLGTELLNKSLLRWLFPKKFPGKERNYSEPIEVNSVIGACMMVRRDALDQFGLLDEDYFLFLEETDLCFRMKKAGWKVYHVPQAEIIHFQGKSAETVKKRARIEFYRSRYHFFKKNRGNVYWLIFLIGMVTKLTFDLVLMGMACFLTLFAVKKWREKLSAYSYLMWWHLRICPEGMGLKPNNKDSKDFAFDA